MREAMLAVLLLGSCNVAGGSADPPGLQLDRPAVVRYHMQRHFSDLRDIQRMLLAGQLDDARARAFLLTKPASDSGLAPFAAESEAVERAAGALVRAQNVAEACRLEARVAQACASCHAHVPKVLAVPPAPTAPGPGTEIELRMARHQWAADRLWEGVVMADARRWRAGLEVMAMTPVPGTGNRRLGRELQQLARDGIAGIEARADTVETRATTYGELLVTCASCHARR